jgi:hypothetical protein
MWCGLRPGPSSFTSHTTKIKTFVKYCSYPRGAGTQNKDGALVIQLIFKVILTLDFILISMCSLVHPFELFIKST